jgi:hypothetical protein
MFSTITETYVFSGFLLVVFYALLQRKTAFWGLLLTGIITFGITISNLIQEMIALTLTELNLKRTLTFTVIVLVASAGLSWLNKAVYPNTGLFYNPGDYGVENQHFFDANDTNGWP